VLVMLFSVFSITTSFTAWWVAGEEIKIETTFLSLSLDILVLLALSSRSAAAYARRKERR
jgi:predicted membrane chloride channel (bestrophin family)